MKVIITESQYNRAIDFYISHLLEPHEVKTNKEYPDFIIWTKNGVSVAQIQNPDYFCLPSDIWNDISRMFDLDYDDTQSLIKIWLEKHYNLGD